VCVCVLEGIEGSSFCILNGSTAAHSK